MNTNSNFKGGTNNGGRSHPLMELNSIINPYINEKCSYAGPAIKLPLIVFVTFLISDGKGNQPDYRPYHNCLKTGKPVRQTIFAGDIQHSSY